VLAVLAAIAGVLKAPLDRWLEPVLAHPHEYASGSGTKLGLILVTTVAALSGVGIAYAIWLRKRVEESAVEPEILRRAWYVDELYKRIIEVPGRALANFMLDLHTREHGYLEIAPPYLVNRATLTGTGQLPKFAEEVYASPADDLFLIPTAEVPVTNIHRDEILEVTALPATYVAYSPCFRREAGSGGKDTRGLIRVHQFDKVELVRLVRPEESAAEHERITSHAETVLQRLELPYRVVELAAGDTGFASARTYDIEVWAAGVGAWLEVSSSSTFTDFQARRANIRYRPAPKAKPEFVHTLNASGVAFPRTIIALLENNQAADGSVRVPAALVPYLGVDRLTPRA